MLQAIRCVVPLLFLKKILLGNFCWNPITSDTSLASDWCSFFRGNKEGLQKRETRVCFVSSRMTYFWHPALFKVTSRLTSCAASLLQWNQLDLTKDPNANQGRQLRNGSIDIFPLIFFPFAIIAGRSWLRLFLKPLAGIWPLRSSWVEFGPCSNAAKIN